MNRKMETTINSQYFRHEGEYLVEGNLHIANNARVGKLVVKGNLVVGGNINADEIYVGGNIFVRKNVSVVGNIYVEGNFEVQCNVCIEGDMYVKGDCTISRFNPRHSNVYIGGKLQVGEMDYSARMHCLVVGRTVEF